MDEETKRKIIRGFAVSEPPRPEQEFDATRDAMYWGWGMAVRYVARNLGHDPDAFLAEVMAYDGSEVMGKNFDKQDNDGWIEWGGGECPVDGKCQVEVKYRSTDRRTHGTARYFRWSNASDPADIIAYRVVSADGNKPECERAVTDPVARVKAAVAELNAALKELPKDLHVEITSDRYYELDWYSGSYVRAHVRLTREVEL